MLENLIEIRYIIDEPRAHTSYGVRIKHCLFKHVSQCTAQKHCLFKNASQCAAQKHCLSTFSFAGGFFIMRTNL